MFFRKLIDSMVRVFGFILANRKIKLTGDSSIKVNLGCGLAVAPGWINVDASLNAMFAGPWIWLIKLMYRISGSNRYYTLDQYTNILSENRFVFHDLARSLPFSESSVDFFYSSHFFEHLFKADAQRLMRDCHAALKEGGILRIAIPDLEYAVEQYKAGKKRQMLENYFFVDDLSSYLARHKYMYDFELIKEVLSNVGFHDVRQCKYREGQVPNLNILDNRPEETLFIEAYK